MLKLDNKQYGYYQFETTDGQGNTYGFNGVIHAFSPNRKITRTFESGIRLHRLSNLVFSLSYRGISDLMTEKLVGHITN